MERVLQPVEKPPIAASRVWFSDGYIYIQLTDKRIAGHPLSWYPRLEKATDVQLNAFELWESGRWIHWEELDEDLSAEGFFRFVK